MTTVLTICDTCKRPEWDAETNEKTDGERLAEMAESGNCPPGVALRASLV